MKVFLVVAALFGMGLLVACGANSTAAGPTLRLGFTLTGITLDGQPVTITQLDARLAELDRQDGSIWLLPPPTPPPGKLGLTLYPQKKRDRLAALERQVMAMIAAHHQQIVSGSMPVHGSLSPTASPYSNP